MNYTASPVFALRKCLLAPFVAMLFLSCSRDSETVDPSVSTTDSVITVAAIPERYGIPESTYKIYDGVIKKNQFLGDILSSYDVPTDKVLGLADASKEVHDVRKLRAGEPYAMFCTKDSSETACYFVVETSPADYVVYQLGDSLSAYLGRKPVEQRVREASGRISSSLSQTIADNNLSPELAVKMSEIYAWTVDFYRLQQGDFFKVVFEETYVDGNPMGVGDVLAAEFHHRDEAVYAFRFDGGEEDEGGEYYDENGESLRKAFLKAPVKFSRISSRYTMKRYHPVQKRWKAHLGTDYAAAPGTPIHSTADGEVIASAYGKYNGNYVKIRHNGTYTTQYLHMSKRLVKKGDYVHQGDVIGKVGSTGLATGPHVCYRFWKNGKQVDPYRQDLPSGDPVDPVHKEQFLALSDSLKGVLDEIPLAKNDEMFASR